MTSVFPASSTRSWLQTFRFVRMTVLFSLGILLWSGTVTAAQQPDTNLPPTPFRIGERLSYNFSFERYRDIAFGEIHVVSRGKLGEADAVELRSRFKTLDLVSAAFFTVDESRTTFAAAETGAPLYVRRTNNASIQSHQVVSNYLNNPANGFDLLTLIYKIRNSGGSGIFTLLENDRTYNVTVQVAGAERVKTDAGEFDTTVSTVQSDFFTELGIQSLKVNLSTDDSRIPTTIRFKTSKGDFIASLSGMQISSPAPDPTPTPQPVQTPRPNPTPKQVATPAPYVANRQLPDELGFSLGEALDYRISLSGKPVATFSLVAKERNLFEGEDSLLLEAAVTSVQSGNGIFSPGNKVFARVNPETLAPQQFEIRLSGPLSSLNQSARFDQRNGAVMFGGTKRVEVPVGSHNLLSLLYALRSINLKPSKTLSNPVNDTRVAVFWDTKAYIFSLRPSPLETIDLNGEKVSAQMVSISTGNPQLDALSIRVWLSNDEKRVPLRVIVGPYQADLISKSTVPLK